MAKGMHVGISGVARKASKIYVGIGGVARKVKKIYVGIEGIARLVWSGDYKIIEILNSSKPYTAQNSMKAAAGPYIYMFGGVNNGTYYNYLYRYNINTQAWTQLTGDIGVADGALEAVGNDLYRFGGRASGSGNSLNHNHKYNTLTDTWETKTALPYLSNGHATAVIGTDIYVNGGYNNGTVLSSYYKYNTLTDTWTQLQANIRRYYHSLVAVNGLIYIFGGYFNASVDPQDSQYVYNPTTNTWTQLASAPYPIAGHTAIVIGTEVHVFGGLAPADSANNSKRHWKYDILTNAWTILDNLVNNIYGLGSKALWASDDIYLIG